VCVFSCCVCVRCFVVCYVLCLAFFVFKYVCVVCGSCVFVFYSGVSCLRYVSVCVLSFIYGVVFVDFDLLRFLY